MGREADGAASMNGRHGGSRTDVVDRRARLSDDTMTDDGQVSATQGG